MFLSQGFKHRAADLSGGQGSKGSGRKTAEVVDIIHETGMGILRIFFSVLPIFRIFAEIRSFELSAL